ncbi:MAG: hypothetical protein WCI18_12060 [Pseudomonadota bacterium]
MKSITKAIFAVVFAMIGLQAIAEKLDFSTARADTAEDDESMNSNGL